MVATEMNVSKVAVLVYQVIIFIEVRVRSSGLFIFRKVYRKGLLRFSS